MSGNAPLRTASSQTARNSSVKRTTWSLSQRMPRLAWMRSFSTKRSVAESLSAMLSVGWKWPRS